MTYEMLLQPFQFAFMQKAFLLCIVVAIPTALLSCFLVLKGWALMGDAISHAVLPGIVIAYIFGAPLVIGAFFASMVCALSTGFLSNNSRIKPDTIMGVVFSGMFGLGIVLITWITTDVHLQHVLFGNLLGVQWQDLLFAGIVGLTIAAIIIVKWKDILLYCFDPAQAQGCGISISVIHYGLLTAIALTIVTTLSASGLILAVGLLISPGAIAFLLTRQFSSMLIVAVGVCVTSMVGGTYASFFIDSAPEPTIILVMTAFFIIAFCYRIILTTQNSSAAIQN